MSTATDADPLALSPTIELAAQEIRHKGFKSELGRYKDTEYPPWSENEHQRRANHRIIVHDDGLFTAVPGVSQGEPFEFPTYGTNIIQDNIIFSPK